MNQKYFISYLCKGGGGSCTMDVDGFIENHEDIVLLQNKIEKQYGVFNVVIMFFKEMSEGIKGADK